MAYSDLLPTPEDLARSLAEQGVPAETIATVFEQVAKLLSEHADFHYNEWERVGEKESRGASSALEEITVGFESSARYATENYGNA